MLFSGSSMFRRYESCRLHSTRKHIPTCLWFSYSSLVTVTIVFSCRILLSEIHYVFYTGVDPSGRTSRPAQYPELFDQHHQAFGAAQLYARE